MRYMEIENLVRHPYYEAVSTGYKNDIALLKLKKDVKVNSHVKIVKLPSVGDTFGPSSECWITGWGQVGNGGTVSTNLYLHTSGTSVSDAGRWNGTEPKLMFTSN